MAPSLSLRAWQHLRQFSILSCSVAPFFRFVDAQLKMVFVPRKSAGPLPVVWIRGVWIQLPRHQSETPKRELCLVSLSPRFPYLAKADLVFPFSIKPKESPRCFPSVFWATGQLSSTSESVTGPTFPAFRSFRSTGSDGRVLEAMMGELLERYRNSTFQAALKQAPKTRAPKRRATATVELFILFSGGA